MQFSPLDCTRKMLHFPYKQLQKFLYQQTNYQNFQSVKQLTINSGLLLLDTQTFSEYYTKRAKDNSQNSSFVYKNCHNHKNNRKERLVNCCKNIEFVVLRQNNSYFTALLKILIYY